MAQIRLANMNILIIYGSNVNLSILVKNNQNHLFFIYFFLKSIKFLRFNANYLNFLILGYFRLVFT